MRHWGLKARVRSSLWDADHIVPVVEGGGECELENLRTLCLRCHRVETLRLRERLRQAKVAMMLSSEQVAEAVLTVDSRGRPCISL